MNGGMSDNQPYDPGTFQTPPPRFDQTPHGYEAPHRDPGDTYRRSYEPGPSPQATSAPYRTVTVSELRANSIIVLILGIVSFFATSLITAIPAWVWGNSLIRQAEDAGIPDDAVVNARVGRTLGMICCAITAVVAILAIIAIGVGAAASL